ncbi:MAG: DUF2062 domain-containing protein [Saprospiraceae bacterium]|nr:DUF2062 domain-containing protein [Saprospiraceae bacterium]MBK8485824.1 DUF2062 domain-containing protein [Saprospiraceae bacterium]MBK9222334.1 DUF2062 domain-containing protein [Saprospiraceae bacterium]MBK9723013.1 DUF2062 domain-containing protein [Saprospiraceae bacterium]MBK9726874.1 DUF2062 domain-containing protein [Saprospiraceae bacterium]
MFRKIRYEIIKVSRAHGTVHEIALGAAIGAFISIFPTFGLGTLLVLLAYRFINFNLVSAISGSLISNIFTSPLFMALSYKIGSLIFKPESALDFKNWYKHLDHLGISVLTGGFILSTFSAFLIYYSVKIIMQYYRDQKLKKSLTQ